MYPVLQLIRWQNLLFLALLVGVMQQWVAVPVIGAYGFHDPLAWWQTLLLMSAVVLIAAGGYVINDYFDVKIDRINRPERLVVTQSVTKEQAMRLFQVTTLVGVLAGLGLSLSLRDWTMATVFVMVPGVLWFYSSSYKRQFLLGNIIIALCAAVVPVLIAMADVSALRLRYPVVMDYLPISRDLFAWLGGFAAFAGLTTLIRELIKDLQDQMGDRELECHTLPIVIGETWTRVVATVLILLLAAAIVVVYARFLPSAESASAARSFFLALFVPVLGELFLLWRSRIPSDYRDAQRLMKIIMLIGTLMSFFVRDFL